MSIVYPTAPWAGGAFIPGKVGSYKYYLTTGNWELPSLSLNKEKLYVTGDAVLYARGNVDVNSGSSIVVESNATLRLYVGGATTTINGSSLVNASGVPERLVYYGLPANTSITYSGNDNWCGVFYAPSAALNWGGGTELHGAFLAKSIKVNGNSNFHYDENLARVSPPRFVITSWLEL